MHSGTRGRIMSRGVLMSRGARIAPYHEELLAAADRYIAADGHADRQVAVVLAQTAAEIQIEQAFDVLGQRIEPVALREWTKRRLRACYSLGNDDVKLLWNALSGQKIDVGQVWADYREVIDLRGDVVHKGRPVSGAEAKKAVRAVRAFLARVEAEVLTPPA
jgi:hypothetical protein